MGLLTAYVYKQAQKNLAIALGVMTGVQLLNIKPKAHKLILNKSFEEQSKKAHRLFCGIEEEFKQMHCFASKAIIQLANNEPHNRNMNTLEDAKSSIKDLFQNYNDTFPSENKNPEETYRAQMVHCYSSAYFIASMDVNYTNEIAFKPLKEEINKIIPIAQTLVYGRPLKANESGLDVTYVNLIPPKVEGGPFQAQLWTEQEEI